MNKIKAGTRLDCGCCGNDFLTWEGYADQDQDIGFGICEPCQKSIHAHDEAEWDKVINVLRGALSPESQTKFSAMDRETQKAFAAKAIEDGHITFSIAPGI